MLVDRLGLPLEIGRNEGNKDERKKKETKEKKFEERKKNTDTVVVADAGMLSAAHLRDLDEPGSRSIVGSRDTKAPDDLKSQINSHGNRSTNVQIIDRITPRKQHVTTVKKRERKKKEEKKRKKKKKKKKKRKEREKKKKKKKRENKTLSEKEDKEREDDAGEKKKRKRRKVKKRKGEKRTRRGLPAAGAPSGRTEGLRH